MGSRRATLLGWFDDNARELPWRGCEDPYAVLVSEVMSQQTRVETVRAYWQRWMVAFPTIGALAAADVEDVMKRWAGLGYYRRARNLHACARAVVDRFDGELPQTAASLQTLPGIGPYTAAAVASIAFGEAVPAVDGNVTRVVSRLGGIGGERESGDFKRIVADAAAQWIEPTRAGSSNEALMELGATLCAPRTPDCARCPLASWCVACVNGTVADFPPRKRRKTPRPAETQAVVAVRDAQVFIRRKPAGGLLGDLWEVPTYDVDSEVAAVEAAAAEHGLAGLARPVGEVEHVFSHIRMTYRVTRVDVAPGGAAVGGRWADLASLGAEALSVAMRRVVGLSTDRAE